jgi:hypothetical protein
MKLTKEEKDEIMSKYNDNTSEQLLKHLKRTFPAYVNTIADIITKMIIINDKPYILKGNKKFLVNKISSILEDEWVFLDKNELRRTVKKYIDGNLYD